ncbi:hypothetical protein FRB96_004629 [Tulasnella sp. 330]|nr:hypothetical protein FRB96_004629 [Tulasnella sp. 330]KAG8879801.1 hypothetical protein FRB97_001371 [Tulasnella sp. 331]
MSYFPLPLQDKEVVSLNSSEHKYSLVTLFNHIRSVRSVSNSTPSQRSHGTHTLPYDVGYPYLAHSGLVFSLLVGISCIGIGAIIFVISPQFDIPPGLTSHVPSWSPGTERNITIPMNHYVNVTLGLAFNFLVTVCTEATGYVHGTTLKWGLVQEQRLEFNANLRLFSATKGAFSVNGPVVNILFLISIVFSYAASASVLFRLNIYEDGTDSLQHHPSLWHTSSIAKSYSIISFLPVLILGIALTLQAVLGLIAYHKTTVHTWSSSPLDVSSALVHHGCMKHRSDRCMRSAASTDDTTAIRPSPHQPKPWACHKSVSRVVYLVWITAIVFLILPWAYKFNPKVSGYLSWDGPTWDGFAPPLAVLQGSLIVGIVQALITVSLHCSELVTTLARDEEVWRAATSAKGAQPSANPLRVLFGSWQTCGLVLWKPVLHWIFGLSLSLQVTSGLVLSTVSLALGPGIIVVAVFVTYIANLKPPGPQPAAYGNVQVLADLVDEWWETMYWGHKGTKLWGASHAGTSSGPLPPVGMGLVYA